MRRDDWREVQKVVKDLMADNADGMSMLCATNEFPSTIQPWLLGQLAHLTRAGARVTVLAESAHSGPVAPVVYDLGLLERTLYVQTNTAWEIGAGIARLLWPRSRDDRSLGWKKQFGVIPSKAMFSSGLGRWCRTALRANALRDVHIHIIHAHGMVVAYDMIPLAELLGVPLVYTFHGLTPEGVEPLWNDKKRGELFRRASGFLVNTRFAQGQLEALGCPQHKIQTIPQSTDLKRFSFCSRSRRDGEELKVLMVGRLHPDKGHQYAFRALRLLKDSGLDVVCRVVGVGPLAGELKTLAAELSIAHSVKFLGAVSEGSLIQEYQTAHIVLFPSVSDPTGLHHTETQGVVVQEAQATGAIVVATRVGGIPECVVDGDSAFLVPERDPEAIAAKIRWLVMRLDRWGEWSRNGRRWVESRFGQEILGERLVSFYKEMIEQHRFHSGGFERG